MHIVGLTLNCEIDFKRFCRSGLLLPANRKVFEKQPNHADKHPVQNTTNPKPVIEQITCIHHNSTSLFLITKAKPDFGLFPLYNNNDLSDQYMQRRKR